MKHRRLAVVIAALCGAAVVLLGGAAAVASSTTAPGHDGSIAFRRFFDDQHTWSALFTVTPGGTNARQVTHPARGTVDNSPDWSPDGRLIAFVRFDGTSDTALEHLWTVHPNGSGLAPVGPLCPPGANETTCPDDTDPSFAPDSKQLTFVQASGTVKTFPGAGREIEHSAIAVVNVDGTGRRVVYQAAAYSSDVAAPMLSPHGAAIVFERDNSSAGRPAGAKAVFVIRTDGTNAHRLTPWAENSGDNPDWSPDGNWILFHTHVDDGKQGQYFLIHPDGTGRKQISHYPNGTFVGSASFSPDGRSIVFAKGPQGGNIDVYTMRLDGTHVRRLTRSNLWDSAPDWGAVATSADRATASASEAFPGGTWRVTVSGHDLVTRGVTGSDVPGNRGVWNWTFTATSWTEKQQERAGGPVTDVHHGRIALRGTRVCFTDTGQKLSLGCYAWLRSGSALRFSKPTFRGPLATGDGPGILKAIFIAHPWLHSARALASAVPIRVSSAIDFTFRSTSWSRRCGVPVFEHQYGTTTSTLFNSGSRRAKEIDIAAGLKTTYFSPLAVGGTGGSFTAVSSATLKTTFPDGISVGAPAQLTFTGLQILLPGLPQAGRDVYQGEVAYITPDGIPLTDLTGFVSESGHFNDFQTEVAALCGALGA